MTRRDPERESLTYTDAGVDTAAGDKAVELIKEHVRSTFRPEVIGDVGGFGGLFAFAADRYRDPVLVASTDGVGTKSVVARLAARHRTIGIDCVAMSVDDVAANGAEPLFFLDYISTGKVVPETIDEIVAGVGVVERSRVLPARVGPGDAIVGFASGGLRCNGYSLARRALLEIDGRALGGPAWAGAHHSLADELLRPSVIYAPSMLEVRRHVDVHAYVHVTGGGIPGNLARVLPSHCDAVVRRDAWERPRVFAEIQAAGAVAEAEMEQVFNLGLGMLAVVPGDAVHAALDAVRSAGHEARVVGEVTAGHGRVAMTS